MTITMTQNKQLADFLIRFQLSCIPAGIAISMAVWAIFKEFDSTTFTLLMLVTLLSSSFVMKRLSYLFDYYCKSRVIQWMNIIMAVVVMITVIIDSPWIYLLLYACCSLYFQVFYTTYNAIAQTLPFQNKQIVSASIEMSGKIIQLFIGGLIWLLFEPLGIQYLLYACVVLFVIAALASASFDTPYKAIDNKLKQKLKNNQKPQRVGFAWYFSQPIAWLVTLAMLPNIVVLLSNTINPIYLYQVQDASAETLAQISMAFSLGSLLGAGAVFTFRNEKSVIYSSVIACALLSVLLAIMPIFTVFLISMAIFGFANSANRVMFRLLIMKNVPDDKVGSFYGLRSSLVSGVQFITLLSMNGALEFYPPTVSVWFYPALFLIVPFLWGMSKVCTSR